MLGLALMIATGLAALAVVELLASITLIRDSPDERTVRSGRDEGVAEHEGEVEVNRKR